MRAIQALLPTYTSARGLPATTLARRVYELEREATAAEVASIDRAAQRLVERGLADSAFVHHLRVYFRAQGAAAPHDAGMPSHEDDEGIVIARSGPLVDREW